MGIRLSKKIYSIENERDIQDTIKRIKKGVLIQNLYLIYVSQNEKNILNIERMNNIFENTQREYFVLGISYSKEDTNNIVKLIFTDYINKGKNICDIKKNLLNDKW